MDYFFIISSANVFPLAWESLILSLVDPVAKLLSCLCRKNPSKFSQSRQYRHRLLAWESLILSLVDPVAKLLSCLCRKNPSKFSQSRQYRHRLLAWESLILSLVDPVAKLLSCLCRKNPSKFSQSRQYRHRPFSPSSYLFEYCRSKLTEKYCKKHMKLKFDSETHTNIVYKF